MKPNLPDVQPVTESADEAIVTPEEVYLNRREILAAAGFIGASVLLRPSAWSAGVVGGASVVKPPAGAAGDGKRLVKSAGKPPTIKYDVLDRHMTEEKHALSYNNYYEFSLEKKDVKDRAARWKPPTPWRIKIDGLVAKPFELNLEAWVKSVWMEDRTYRFRCVEAWSMVLPWRGFPLWALIEKAKPKPEAKFVRFVTYQDKRVMPNLTAMPHYAWPYTEGLTIEEAKHPLTFMATGLYGKPLANQNGAPVRLVVPWKYGFKSIKSITQIEFVAEQPKTLWNQLAPAEYGFYANVNPDVRHPRWRQDRETMITGDFLPKRIPTLKFNGYEKEVASLYAGMDLSTFY